MEESPNWDDWVQALMSMCHGHEESHDEVGAIHQMFLDELNGEADSIIEEFLGMLEPDSGIEQMQEIKGVVAKSGGGKKVRFDLPMEIDDPPIYLAVVEDLHVLVEAENSDAQNGGAVDMESVGVEEKFLANSTEAAEENTNAMSQTEVSFANPVKKERLAASSTSQTEEFCKLGIMIGPICMEGKGDLEYMDVCFTLYVAWYHVIEKLFGLKLPKGQKCPCLHRWIENLLSNEEVRSTLPEPYKLFENAMENGVEKDAEEADPFGLDQTEVKKALRNFLQKEGVVIDWEAWKQLIRSVLEQRLKPCNVGLFSK